MKDKDITLVETLKESCNSGYKCNNGALISYHTISLEKTMTIFFYPRSNIKVIPHIESKIKT